MKTKKQIIEMIKKDNEKIKVNNYSKNILTKIENNQILEDNEVTYVKPKSRFNHKLAITSCIVCVILLISSISLININRTNEPKRPIVNTNSSKNLSYQAVTLFNYAYQEEITKNIRRRNYSSTEYDLIANEIDHYFMLATSILTEDNFNYTDIFVSNSQYENNLKVSINVLNYHQEYQISYNEVIISENKHEKTYKIDGMIQSNNLDYIIKGTKEESKGECEIELKLIIDDITNEYLVLSQETEHHENEYSYKHYKSNQLIEEFEIEHEQDGSINKVDVEVTKNNIEYEYEFIYLTNHIDTKYEINEYSGNVKIYIENGKHRYVFNNYEKII